MKQVGIIDIAKEAGVSTATVSRVLNRPEKVSEKTREHVLAVIERRWYRPNVSAAALRRGRSKTIGIAVASISQPWYAKLIRELRRAVTAQGYTTVVYDLEHSARVLIEHTESARHLRLSGMILATGDCLDPPEVKSALLGLAEAMPLVVIGQQLEDATWPTLHFDDIAASESATRELLARRARPLLFLGTSERSFLSAQRMEGVRRALRDYPELEAASTFVHFGDSMSYDAGYAEAIERAEELADYGLVFCANDELALGMCRGAMELGLSVPGDLMIIGYGDIDFLPYITPSLSSLSGEVVEVAVDALEAIMARISGESSFSLRMYSRQIMHRESTTLG